MRRFPQARSRRLLSLLAILSVVGLLAIERRFSPTKKTEVVEVSTAHESGATEAHLDAPLKLDIEALEKRSLPELSPTLFGSIVAAPLSSVIMQPPPVKASPPPLPYTYLGQFRDADGRFLFYLRRNNEIVVARPGSRLDDNYQLESDLRNGLTFTYLPLKEAQVIPIGSFAQ